jgi:hypothetical protein
MKNVYLAAILLLILAGCHSDIVTTKNLKAIRQKCVFLEPIQSEDPYVGQVLRDVLEKEFVRKKVNMGDPNEANIFLTGSTFLTNRAAIDAKGWTGRKSAAANEAIESVTLIAKDREGNILLTASYDNRDQYTASKLAQEFGQNVAGKLR